MSSCLWMSSFCAHRKKPKMTKPRLPHQRRNPQRHPPKTKRARCRMEILQRASSRTQEARIELRKAQNPLSYVEMGTVKSAPMLDKAALWIIFSFAVAMRSISQTHGSGACRVPVSSRVFSGQTPKPAETVPYGHWPSRVSKISGIQSHSSASQRLPPPG